MDLEGINDIPPIHNVDLKLLRIFKSVVEAKGFSAAEEHLGVGRSTISKHISGLESRLNVRLCERGRSGFSITPHGLLVYSATIELLDALDSFRSKVSISKGILLGDVNLWTMDNSHNESKNPLPRAIARFKERAENVHITLNAADPKSVEEAVVNGLAHVGLTIANSEDPELTYKVIGQEVTSLYCANIHAKRKNLTDEFVSEDDLAGCDFVRRGYLRNDNNLKERVWRSTATARHVEATIQLILTGQYIGILPDHIAERWIKSGAMYKVKHSQAIAMTDIYIIYRKKSISNPTIAALVANIQNTYKIIRK